MMFSQLFLILVKEVHSYVVVWTGGRRSAEGTALPGVCGVFISLLALGTYIPQRNTGAFPQ